MYRLRRFLLANRPFACAILALALTMKFAVPAGFMPTVANGEIVVGICSGTGHSTMVVTIPGTGQEEPDGEGRPGRTDQPCAFSGMSAPSLAATDPILLAGAISFVLALGTRSMATPASTAQPYLRPPLRGPPTLV